MTTTRGPGNAAETANCMLHFSFEFSVPPWSLFDFRLPLRESAAAHVGERESLPYAAP
jgi:hypothetical protein